MSIPIQSQVSNPISGVFGIGQIQMFSNSGVWNVPPGVAKVRVRLWGAGAPHTQQASFYGGGGGGGFAIKTIYDLTGVASVPVIIGLGAVSITASSAAGLQAGTSSFGSYCSATGGIYGRNSDTNFGGIGIGGDVNNSGGKGGYGGATAGGGGGGSASLIGNGGNATITRPQASTGGAGAGWGAGAGDGGPGFMTRGGVNSPNTLPDVSAEPFSIDFIGTGGGGSSNGSSATNGGGGGLNGCGGFPGGGNGVQTNVTSPSGQGLVIVEW